MDSPSARTEALRRVAEALNETVDAEAAIAALLPELEGVLGLRTAWAFRFHPENGAFSKISATGLPPALASDDQRPLREGICECQRRYLSGELREAVNMVTCSRLAKAVGDRQGLSVHASVPLRSRERILGILNVAAPGGAHFTPESLSLLSSVGSQLAVALDRAESYAAKERRARQLEALAEIARRLTAQDRVDEVLRTTVTLGVARLDIPRLGVVVAGSAQPIAWASSDSARLARPNAPQVPLQPQQWTRPGPAFFSGSQAGVWRPVSGEELLVAETRHLAFDPSDFSVIDALAAQLETALSAARRQTALRHAAVLEERQRIAADLHDAVSQRLFCAILNLHAAGMGIDRQPTVAAQQLEIAEGQVRLAQSELRTLAGTLLSGTGPSDLPAALRDLVQALAVPLGPRVVARISPHAPGIPDAAAVAFLRVAQEALHNALRHSQATAVRVSAGVRAGSLLLTVRDNGVGFDPSRVPVSGIASMRARAASVGATLLLRSSPRAGTTVRMRLAVPSEGGVQSRGHG